MGELIVAFGFRKISELFFEIRAGSRIARMCLSLASCGLLGRFSGDSDTRTHLRDSGRLCVFKIVDVFDV